jgi:hypothetical protein
MPVQNPNEPSDLAKLVGEVCLIGKKVLCCPPNLRLPLVKGLVKSADKIQEELEGTS